MDLLSMLGVTGLRPASFKGVAFYVDETEGTFGRRTVVHEYPYRDVPFVEDLGKAADALSFTGFVMTQAACEALIAAIQSEGAGTLIHPWSGSHFVAHDGPVRVQYPRASGGRFVFSLSFIEAGENTEPDVEEDAGGLLGGLIDDALDAVGLQFAKEWLNDIAGWADMALSRVDALMAGIEYYLTPFEQAMSLIKSIQSGGLLSKPLELYYRISGLLNQASNIRLLPFGSKLEFNRMMAKSSAFVVKKRTDAAQVNLLVLAGAMDMPWNHSASVVGSTGNTGGFSSSTDGSSGSTSSGGSLGGGGTEQEWGNGSFNADIRDLVQQQRERPEWTYPHTPSSVTDLPLMPPSLADAVRRTLVLNQAKELGSYEYDSKDDIVAARDECVALLDLELAQCDNDIFRALQQVRMQIVRTAAARLPTLREVETLQTKAVLPALVLAYQVNGSIDAYDDLVARNKVRQPLYVPAGKVEVVRDGQ